MSRLLADPDIGDAAKRGVADAITQIQNDKETAEAGLSALLDDAIFDTDKLVRLTAVCLQELQTALHKGQGQPDRLNSLIERFVGPFKVGADRTIEPIEESGNRPGWRRQEDSNLR